MTQVLYGSLADHADAMLALLRAEMSHDPDDPAVYPTEDGGATFVPNGAAAPYVAVHFVADRPIGGTLDMRSTRMRLRAYAYCVGANDLAARLICDRVAAAWLDVRPDVPGRVSYPIRSEGERPDPPRGDESTGRLSVTITEIYRWETVPGSSGS